MVTYAQSIARGVNVTGVTTVTPFRGIPLTLSLETKAFPLIVSQQGGVKKYRFSHGVHGMHGIFLKVYIAT